MQSDFFNWIFEIVATYFYPDNQAKAYPRARSRGRSRRLLRGYSPEGRVCAKHKSGYALSRIGVSNRNLLRAWSKRREIRKIHQPSIALSLLNSSPLALENNPRSCSTVSFSFSSPETSTMILPSCIIIRRLPYLMASRIL